jgi:hypothetical protein
MRDELHTVYTIDIINNYKNVYKTEILTIIKLLDGKNSSNKLYNYLYVEKNQQLEEKLYFNNNNQQPNEKKPSKEENKNTIKEFFNSVIDFLSLNIRHQQSLKTVYEIIPTLLLDNQEDFENLNNKIKEINKQMENGIFSSEILLLLNEEKLLLLNEEKVKGYQNAIKELREEYNNSKDFTDDFHEIIFIWYSHALESVIIQKEIKFQSESLQKIQSSIKQNRTEEKERIQNEEKEKRQKEEEKKRSKEAIETKSKESLERLKIYLQQLKEQDQKEENTLKKIPIQEKITETNQLIQKLEETLEIKKIKKNIQYF